MTPTGNKYRKHLRVLGFDYRENCAYFVTICTGQRRCIFGEIVDAKLCPTQRALISAQCWLDIPNHHPFVELDAYIIMPNHLHGVLNFVANPVAATPASPLVPKAHGPSSNSLGSVVGSFKSAVTRKINKLRPGTGTGIWQPNYYEHIIRNDSSLERIRDYIDANPARWNSDEENLNGNGKDRLMIFLDSLGQFDGPRGDAGVAATEMS